MSRNWDIYSIEKRVYELEKNGGGSPSPTPTPTGDIYSETETEIGTYLGEKLYRKVIPTTITSLSSGSNTVGSVTDLSINTLVKVGLVAKSSSSDTWTNCSYFLGGAIRKNGNLVVRVDDSWSNITECKAIIEYTKVASDAKSTKRSKKA